MLKILLLAAAISEVEGWYKPGTKGFKNGSVAWRNNNPGNLRSSPKQVYTKDGFAKFSTLADGCGALTWDLWCKATNRTRTKLTPKSTLRDLFKVWAPTADGNDPEAYLQKILKITGFKATMKLEELL